MNDLEWLALRTGALALSGHPVAGAARHRAGIVVEPTRVAEALRADVPVIAVVGWPDGRHHSVIKAAEARLAVDMGASGVWLCVNVDAAGENEVLADVLAVRQAVEEPATIGLVYAGRPEVARAGELVGVDTLVCAHGETLPETPLPIAVHGVEDSTDAVVDALSAGAEQVFTAPPPLR